MFTILCVVDKSWSMFIGNGVSMFLYDTNRTKRYIEDYKNDELVNIFCSQKKVEIMKI